MSMLETDEIRRHTFPIAISTTSNPEKYQQSPMYHDLIEYMLGGEARMDELRIPKNRRRALRHRAKQYKLLSHAETQHLRFVEPTGASSICITEEEIPRFLNAAHEDHGHYATALTLDFLIGRAYWPSRVKDVHDWCRSCHSCQLRMRKPIKSVPLTIQGFQPMTMLGADWLGPIKPKCTATGALYVLLVVDYFSRFIWAQAFKDHTALEVIYMLRDVIAPIFGWPKGFYSDNGSHFVNYDVEALLQEHGVSQFTVPISHPASTGLLERAVQEMLAMISKKCIQRGTTNSWGLFIRDNVLEMNTKATRIHGYQPAQIMLGFEPQQNHYNIDPTPLLGPRQAEETMPAMEYQLFAALREENRMLASDIASYQQSAPKGINRQQRLPEPGDLVLVWNHSKQSQKSRKLEAKWLGPRMLVRWTNHKQSGWVRELHGQANAKWYHLNDIILYHERQKFFAGGVQLATPTCGSTSVVQSTIRIHPGRAGQRALYLT